MSLLNYLDCICILHVYKLVTFQTFLLFSINQDYKCPKYDLIILFVVLNLGQTIKIKREREVLSNEADVEKSNHLNPI